MIAKGRISLEAKIEFGESSFANHLRRLFIIAHGDEGAMRQVPGVRPFDELDLADQFHSRARYSGGLKRITERWFVMRRRLERLHDLHYHRQVVNFGISTTIWDRLFGTFEPTNEPATDYFFWSTIRSYWMKLTCKPSATS